MYSVDRLPPCKLAMDSPPLASVRWTSPCRAEEARNLEEYRKYQQRLLEGEREKLRAELEEERARMEAEYDDDLGELIEELGRQAQEREREAREEVERKVRRGEGGG